MDIEKTLTLCLNAQWIPCEFKTGKQAIMSMCGGDPKNPLSVAISLTYDMDKDGNVDYNTVLNLETYSWEDWINLPIRKYDYSINSVNKKIRIPTVIIHQNFNKNILKRKRLTKKSILERDSWVCQYSGLPLTMKTATIDHIVPKSKGGETSWENCVAAHKNINNKKGNKSNEELGLKLKSVPKEPRGSYLYEDIIRQSKNLSRIHDWNYFLKSFKD